MPASESVATLLSLCFYQMGNKPPNEGFSSESDLPAIGKVTSKNTRRLFIDHEDCKFAKNIDECASFQRINAVLIKYQKWLEAYMAGSEQENTEKLPPFWQIINDEQIGYNNTILLDDYHHLLHVHTFTDVYIHANYQCAFGAHPAPKEETKENTDAKWTECICLTRNHRDKTLKTSSLSDYHGISNEEINVEQIMDTIHCYFYHAYDLGYTLSKTESEYIFNGSSNQVSVSSHNSTANGSNIGGGFFGGLFQYHSYLNPDNLAHTDCVMKTVRKQKRLQSQVLHPGIDHALMKGEHIKIRRIKHTLKKKKHNFKYHSDKFVTHCDLYDSDTRFKEETKISEDARSERVFDDFAENKWIKYEYYHEEKPFFVEPKYESLRFELLNDLLSIKQFNILYIRATNHANKEYAKFIKSDGKNGLPQGMQMSLQHLSSILAYCNFPEVRRLFVSTFYRSSNKQSQNMVKAHAEFAHFGRFLFETVHCFGGLTNTKDRFYHAINRQFYFISGSFGISAPFSATNKIQIAMMQCMIDGNHQQGLIMEFKQDMHWDHVKYFQCKSLSDYSHENEVLFMNTDRNTEKFVLTKIVNISHGYDYSIWYIVLKIVYCIFSGQQYKTKHLNQIVLKNVQNLLQYERINAVFIPQYIRNSIRLLIQRTTEITIRWPDIENFYAFIKPWLLTENQEFVNLSNILNTFSNCTCLTVNGSLDKSLYFTPKCMDHIYEYLSSLDAKKRDKQIRIKWIDENSLLSFDEAISEYKEKFAEIQYALSMEQSHETWATLIVQYSANKLESEAP